MYIILNNVEYIKVCTRELHIVQSIINLFTI